MAAAAAEVAAKAAKTAFSAATITPASTFVPRQVYEGSSQIVRSYFLGHHNAALDRMRRTLSGVGLVIECRDMRVPLTSVNPLLESTLMYNTDFRDRQGSPPSGGGSTGGRSRIIVYTHRDLIDKETRALTRNLLKHHKNDTNSTVLFHGAGTEGRDTKGLLKEVKRIADGFHSLSGMRAFVVGMPNAGKSTLLNRLRTQGAPGSAKVAKTGCEPGVTRKLGTPVRILPSDDDSEGVFMLDTPGVFIPYVSDAESMLKLALVGCVKDGLISWITVADYLLFHLNLHDPTGEVYRDFCAEPTNDVHEFLGGVARRTGKLLKCSGESLDGAADWVVRRWRNGELGRFALDQVDDASLKEARLRALEPPLSLNQARKRDKETRKEKSAAKHAQRL